MDRDAIERHGGVSESYLDGVVEIARELGGDGEGLIEALRARDDERLQRFRSKTTEGLESFLIEEGYIDPRSILWRYGGVCKQHGPGNGVRYFKMAQMIRRVKTIQRPLAKLVKV